jgi:hypothetical protein
MSDTIPQSVSNGCRKYVKSRIIINTFNTFNNVAKTDKDVMVHMRCATTWIAFGLKEIKSIKVNSKFDMLLSLEDGRELYVDEIKPVYIKCRKTHRSLACGM